MSKKEIVKVNQPIIIEDVAWFCEDEEGKCNSIARKTFYYNFLMDHASDSISGESNRQAAQDFDFYEELYVFLINKKILNDPRFCLDWTQIEGGATFTFNLSEALKVYDLESMLKESFPQAEMQKYIETLMHPADGFRCDFCGAYSFSRRLSCGNGKDKRTYCLSCHPLNDDVQDVIKKEYERNGTLEAVRERLAYIEYASHPKIASGQTINTLLDQFILGNEESNEFSNRIQEILDENELDEWETFGYDDVGVILWNRKRLSDINIFNKCVFLNEEGDGIIMIVDRAGVIYSDEKAIDFAEKMKKEKEKK